MSKQGLSIFGLRNRMIFFTLIGVMILGSQLLTAQSQQQGRLSPELQPVFKTYPIARVQASEAERVLSEVFANRSISVSHNAAQNTVQLWATQAEHAQIEHFLRQQQVLGTTQVSQGGSQNLAVMARQNAGHSVNGTPQRFVEANRNGRNIPAVWQVQNGEQRYPIRQVAGQTQAPPSLTANRASRHVVLKNLSVRQFEDKILTALQSRSVQPSRSIAGNQTYYSIPLPANQGTVEMMIESQSGVVTVTAPTALQVESFAQIIEMIDNEPQDVITAVVAVAQSNEQTLRDAIGMVNQAGGVRQFTGQSVGQDLQFRTPATGGDVRFGTQNGGTGTQQILPPDVGGLVGPVEVVILDGGMVVINARIASDMGKFNFKT